MASDKFMAEYAEVIRKMDMYRKNLNGIIKSEMPEEDKKRVLTIFLGKVNDLILDCRKIFYDTKSSYREVEFEQSKTALIKCLKLQNDVCEQLLIIEEKRDKALAFRYNGAVGVNNKIIKEIRDEKIEPQEKTIDFE